MKKIALIMFFAVLSAMLIAFNYLLWDRESTEKALSELRYANATDNLSISSLNREVKNLDSENQTLRQSIRQLEGEKSQLTAENEKYKTETGNFEKTLNEKAAIVNALKNMANIDVLEVPVIKWAATLNTKDFNKAYQMQYGSMEESARPYDLNEYTGILVNSLKSVKLKSAAIDKKKGTESGDIYLDVVLEAVLLPDSDSSTSLFRSGQNNFSIKLGYDPNAKEFILSEVTRQ